MIDQPPASHNPGDMNLTHAEASGQGTPPARPPGSATGAKESGRVPTIHPKIAAGALSGAVVTIGAWVLSTYAHVNPPPDVVAAATTVVYTIVAWLVPSSAGQS